MEQENKRLLEKRKYIRLPFETEVKYKIENSKDDMMYTAKSNNISAEGLCLTSKRHIEKGAILSIQVTIKELPPCSVTGEVMWVKNISGNEETMVGIKILDIGYSDRNRFLLELCDKMVNELGRKYPDIKF